MTTTHDLSHDSGARVAGRVNAVIANVCSRPTELILPGDLLCSIGIAGALGRLRLAYALENAFHIRRIQDRDYLRFETVQDVAEYVEARAGGGRP